MGFLKEQKQYHTTYPTLSVTAFSRKLVETEDLDPVYCLLHRADLDESTLKRWLLAYWCYYHCGVASLASERTSKGFYATLRLAQAEKWSRGAERRHFRGSSEEKALTFLENTYPQPEKAVDVLLKHKIFQGVSEAIQKWPIFGPWIAFKAADMLERCLGAPIDFSDCELSMYKEPVEGAKMIDPFLSIKEVVQKVLKGLDGLKAPPSYDRSCGLQEAESCCCKWHSHMKGSYPIGKDSREVKHALTGNWGKIGERLLAQVKTLGKGSKC